MSGLLSPGDLLDDDLGHEWRSESWSGFPNWREVVRSRNRHRSVADRLPAESVVDFTSVAESSWNVDRVHPGFVTALARFPNERSRDNPLRYFARSEIKHDRADR